MSASGAGGARTELSATGTPALNPGRHPAAPPHPQGLQIARLAAQGLTNRDIRRPLFLSPRTVAHHLYGAYRKLDITSRTGLTTVLRPDPGHDAGEPRAGPDRRNATEGSAQGTEGGRCSDGSPSPGRLRHGHPVGGHNDRGPIGSLR
ncbi:response regulator transcription factor [Kitasatospora sp. NPDC001132]